MQTPAPTNGVISHLDILLTFVGFIVIHTVILVWYIARRDMQHRMMWNEFAGKHRVSSNGEEIN